MHNIKVVIATITVIFVLILIIMSGVTLLLWTNHARITERQIKRIRAFYTAEAALARALDELRRTGAVSSNLNLNGLTANLTYNSPTDSVTAKVNY